MASLLKELEFLASLGIVLLGACIGSFLNVCIWRIPREQNLLGRSHCTDCGKLIAFYDNLPILSWFLLRGSCRHCKARIHVRYPLLEALMMLLFLLLWERMKAQEWPLGVFCIYLFLVSALVVIACIDLEHRIIPNTISYSSFIIAIIVGLGFPSIHLYIVMPSKGQELEPVYLLRLQYAFITMVLGIFYGTGILCLLSEIGKRCFGRHTIRCDQTMHIKLDPQGYQVGNDCTNWEDCLVRRTDTLVIYGRMRTMRVKTCYANRAWSRAFEACKKEKRSELRIRGNKLTFGATVIPLHAIDQLSIESQHWIEPQEVLGVGDLKLMAVLGAFLGPIASLFILFIGSFLASFMALILILSKKLKVSDSLAFAPYLAGAAFLYMLFSTQIVHDFPWLLTIFLFGMF